MEGSSKYTYIKWKPQDAQLQRLKEEYRSRGGKMPSVKEARDIVQQLQQYGPIEPRNIYFWFQNQKRKEHAKATLFATSTTSSAKTFPFLVSSDVTTTEATTFTSMLFNNLRPIDLNTSITSPSRPPISINTLGALSQRDLNGHFLKIQNAVDCMHLQSYSSLLEGVPIREQASTSTLPRGAPSEECPVQTVTGPLSLFPVRIDDVTRDHGESTDRNNMTVDLMAQDVDLDLRLGPSIV